MKIIAFGTKDPKWLKIGDSDEQSKWYYAGSTVEKFMKNFAVGDEVKLTSKFEKDENGKGRNVLSFIQKIEGSGYPGGATRPEDMQGPGDSPAPQKPKFTPAPSAPKSGFERSPEVQDSIKRQAIGNMTSRALIALQGHVTPDNVYEMIDNLYAKFQEKVG